MQKKIANELRTVATALVNIATILEANANEVTVETTAPPATEPVKENKVVTLAEVRGVLANLAKDGHRDKVAELIKEFGATKLSEVPAEKYAELLAKAEDI